MFLGGGGAGAPVEDAVDDRPNGVRAAVQGVRGDDADLAQQPGGAEDLAASATALGN